jgi:ATP-dependent metalloprotease
MSELLGPVEYYQRYENLSSETRAMVEGEVQKLMKASYEDVRKLLTDNRKELDRLAKALVEYETLDRSEVEKVIRGEQLANKPKLPKGPLVVPIPEGTPVPGLSGVGVPQPPGSTAPPAPTAPSGAQ